MARPWYPWYPGDYARATAHLSFIEDAAYRRLLDHYYSTGKIPANAEILLRVCRAISQEEQAAVAKVADEFFTEQDGFLVQDRVVEEIRKSRYLTEIRSDAGRKGASMTNGKSVGKDSATDTANTPANNPAIADTTTTTTTTTTTGTPVNANAFVDAGASTGRSVQAIKTDRCPYEKVIAAYHQHFQSGRRVSTLNDKRKRAISARWREVIRGEYRPAGELKKTRDSDKALRFFERYFAYCESLDWCSGREPMRGGRTFRATIDNLMGADFMAKRSDEAHDAREAA